MEKSPLSIPALSTDAEELKNFLITPRTNASSRGVFTNRDINDVLNLQDRVDTLEQEIQNLKHQNPNQEINYVKQQIECKKEELKKQYAQHQQDLANLEYDIAKHQQNPTVKKEQKLAAILQILKKREKTLIQDLKEIKIVEKWINQMPFKGKPKTQQIITSPQILSPRPFYRSPRSGVFQETAIKYSQIRYGQQSQIRDELAKHSRVLNCMLHEINRDLSKKKLF